MAGNSVAAHYPVLAQQGAPYLLDQLHQFAAQGRRPDGGVMGAFAVALSAREMEALADYFSRQPLHPSPAAEARPNERGERLFQDGLESPHVPACASCHGVRGDGLPPKFPRLAGQHARYLAIQLHRYRDGSRISDRQGLMREVAAGLSDVDIDALARYAASLQP